MFDNVTIIQFDNLPNQEEACQYKQTWIQARGKEGVAIRVHPFLSTVLFPVIIYWENNKLAPPDFTDSMQKFHTSYSYWSKFRFLETRELPPTRIINLF